MPRLLFSLLVPVLLTFWFPNVIRAELTKQQRATLDQVILPALDAGNSEALIEGINRLVGRTNSETIAVIDAELQETEKTTLGEMLLTARMANIRSGQRFLIPKLQTREALLTLIALRTAIKESFDDVKSLSVMATDPPIPQKIAGYEELFWSVKEAQNQAGIAAEIAQNLPALAKLAKSLRTKITDEELKHLDDDHEAFVERMQNLLRETQEREIELSIFRLEFAVEKLKRSEDLKEKILAAHFVDYDGWLLDNLYEFRSKTNAEPFLNNDLNDPVIAIVTREKIAEGQEAAGDLMNKSRLFYTAMHWWLRGCYGIGPQFYGLVKNPKTNRSDATQNGLAMPNEIPSDKSSTAFDYPERRHHYTWSWEERTLQVSVSTSSTPLAGTGPTGGLTTGGRQSPPAIQRSPICATASRTIIRPGVSRFGSGFSGTRRGPVAAINIPPGRQYGPINRPYSWSLSDVYRSLGYPVPTRSTYTPRPSPPRTPTNRVTTTVVTYIDNQDPNLIYRVVGFSEYTNSLLAFSGLYKYCTESELLAMDELVKERSEFEIEVNLSRKLEHSPSTLVDEVRLGDNSKRRGLRWISALARAEVATALAGFAAQQDAFATLATKHDQTQFEALILDGARCHFWSMSKDPGLRLAFAGDSNVNRTLAHARQQIVAESLLRAIVKLNPNRFDDNQKQELTRWKTALDKIQETLVERIAQYHTYDEQTNQR
jgi:hypothetical protein